MANRKLIYLAGAIFDKEDANNWRKEFSFVAEQWDYEVFNPYALYKNILNNSNEKDIEDIIYDLERERYAIYVCLKYLKRSNFIIANLNYSSFNTAMELMLAKYMNKTVIGFLKNEVDEINPRIKLCCNIIVNNLDDVWNLLRCSI